jgi:hypothetical protein
VIAGLVALTLIGGACTKSGSSSTESAQNKQALLDQAAATNPGAVLRSTLDKLFGEHVALIADAAAAQAQGRSKDVLAAQAVLVGQNSTDLATAFGQIYPDVQASFLSLWKKHISFFLSYGAAAAKGNSAGKSKAVADLTAYAATFAAFLHAQNDQLPASAVEALFKAHATTVLAVIDAEVAKDYPKAYAALVAAYEHMDMIGKALAVAIRAQHPEKVAGRPDSKPADLREQLDMALEQHSILAFGLVSAVIGKRAPDAAAAVAALNTNASNLAAIIGTQFGNGQTEFGNAWAKLIPAYEGLARGITAKNATTEGKYRDDLATAADGIGKVLNGLDSGLDAGATADFIKLHALSIKEAGEYIAKGKFDIVYGALTRAIGHMEDMAAEIADAIATKFPAKFA